MAEIPYRFDPDVRVEDLIANYADLEPATETSDGATIAGRLMRLSTVVAMTPRAAPLAPPTALVCLANLSPTNAPITLPIISKSPLPHQRAVGIGVPEVSLLEGQVPWPAIRWRDWRFSRSRDRQAGPR